MTDYIELKAKLLDAAKEEYKEKGLKFTMDDIASRLFISKKTIYKVFKDKTDLCIAMVDNIFEKIKECEKRVLENAKLSVKEKLRAVMSAMPDSIADIDFSQMYALREKYPEIFKRVQEKLESGWELTTELLNQGIREGVFRPVNISIFKHTFSAALEQFFSRDFLNENNLRYDDALCQITDLLISGIENK